MWTEELGPVQVWTEELWSDVKPLTMHVSGMVAEIRQRVFACPAALRPPFARPSSDRFWQDVDRRGRVLWATNKQRTSLHMRLHTCL